MRRDRRGSRRDNRARDGAWKVEEAHGLDASIVGCGRAVRDVGALERGVM